MMKEFRITVANKSEGDIIEHVLVFENVSTFFEHSNLFEQTNHVLM